MAAISILERLRETAPLRPLLRPPSIPVSVGLCQGLLTFASLAEGDDGSPYLEAWGSVPVEDARTPTSLTQPNLGDPADVAASLRSLVDSTEAEIHFVNLVVPDRAARVNLLDLDDLPSSHAEQEENLRWRLRKTTPFPIDEARLDWQSWPGEEGRTTVLVVAVRREILGQYEAILEMVDGRAGSVQLESFSLHELCSPLSPGGDWAILLLSEEGFVLLALREDRPIFYRCKTYHLPPSDLVRAIRSELIPSMEYYRDRIQGRGLKTVFLAGTVAVDPQMQEAVQACMDAPLRLADPSERIHLPEDLELSSSDLAALAPILGPASRKWSP